MREPPSSHELLLTAEQAQRRLGVGRSLLGKLAKYHGVPQFVESVRGHDYTRSLFRSQDVEQLYEPVRRVLRAATNIASAPGARTATQPCFLRQRAARSAVDSGIVGAQHRFAVRWLVEETRPAPEVLGHQ